MHQFLPGPSIHPEGFNGLSVPGDSFTFAVVQTFRNSPYRLRSPMILLRYSLVMETFHALSELSNILYELIGRISYK